MTTLSGRRVLLGEIAGAHGIRGEVLIRTFTAEPEGIAAYGPLEDQFGERRFTITIRRVTDKGVIAAIDGIAERTAAERMRGAKLYVERCRLPAAAPGEYYHADLVGLKAVAPDGALIGTVVALANYGAGDLLEVAREGRRATELVPLTEGFVSGIDLKAGTVTVSLPVYTEPEASKGGGEAK